MADDANMQAHVATYAGLTKLLFWGAIGCAAIAFFVIWLIS